MIKASHYFFKISNEGQAERQRDSNGEIVFKKVAEKQVMFHDSSASGNRRQFLEAILQYDRRFGDHSVGGTLNILGMDMSTYIKYSRL